MSDRLASAADASGALQPLMDRVTTAGALGALASPVWLPTVADLSAYLAFYSQLAGALWLTLQIVQWFRKRAK